MEKSLPEAKTIAFAYETIFLSSKDGCLDDDDNRLDRKEHRLDSRENCLRGFKYCLRHKEDHLYIRDDRGRHKADRLYRKMSGFSALPIVFAVSTIFVAQTAFGATAARSVFFAIGVLRGLRRFLH
jgi:hypothetical protein